VLDDPAGSQQVECLVPTLRLDDYGFKSVALVKIDVEGHEQAVLRGAEETLRQCSPTILVELEERHCPGTVRNVSAFLSTLGYDGFFILDGAVMPISEFVQSSHQNPAHIGTWKEYWVRRGVYVHNFFFLPSSRKQRLHEALLQLGAGSRN
jgi:Methyltransferase FkbM domain